MPNKVLFDVNVLLDVIEDRQPFVMDSGNALLLAEERKIEGFIAASSVDTLAFLIRRNSSSATMYRILKDLLSILEVATVDQNVIQKAINLGWKDPEDAIIYEAAKHSGCNFIVTRNVRDFKKASSELKIILPAELLDNISQ